MKTLFIYSRPVDGFSGQAAATELIVDGLRQRSVEVVTFITPAIDRSESSSGLVLYVRYLLNLLGFWCRAFAKRLAAFDAIHLTLGQTPVAMVRDGVGFFLCSFCRRRNSCVRAAALNGSVFMGWMRHSLNARLFRWVLSGFDYVSCLGEQQRRALINLGIPGVKIRVIPNVCEYSANSDLSVRTKHGETGKPLRLLYLSSLIDTKGFPEYLDALSKLANQGHFCLDAVLCGPITMSPYGSRFQTSVAARSWITEKVSEINKSSSVRLRWVEGARGDLKCSLFEAAQVFVLPTRYRVEAQPLAIIEAMAHGCAIVTSAVGEIPSTVDADSAIILEDPSLEKVAEAIEALAGDPDLRLRLGLGAVKRFRKDFSYEEYIRRWATLLLGRMQGNPK